MKTQIVKQHFKSLQLISELGQIVIHRLLLLFGFGVFLVGFENLFLSPKSQVLTAEDRDEICVSTPFGGDRANDEVYPRNNAQ